MTEMRVMTSLNLGPFREILEQTGAIALVEDSPRRGDTKLIWDPRNAQEVESAKRTFEELVKAPRGVGRRFLAFRVAPGGGQGEQITEFDPAAEKLLIIPPVAGGED